jgi:hypothetical protein
MNEEYAVEPSAVEKLSELRHFISRFGFYEGRFIARFPHRWVRVALEAIADDEMRYRAHVLFENARRTGVFISSTRKFDSSRSWLQNAISYQSGDMPFTAVVATQAHLDCQTLDSVELDGGPGERFRGDVGNILNALSILLRTARTLYLVDPFFHPWAANTKPLFNAMLREAFSNKVQALEAYVSADEWQPPSGTLTEVLQNAIENRWDGKKRVTIHLCESHDMHMRYLFCENGGVRLDKGLQVSPRVNIEVSYIAAAVHNSLMQQYVERPPQFQVSERATVVV